MKTILLVIAALCWVQPGAQFVGGSRVRRFGLSMPQADMASALATLNNLFNTLSKSIKNAQSMIGNYHDNATNYADQYKKLQQDQINAVQKLVEVAIAEAEANVSSKNTKALSCLGNMRSEMRNVAVGLMEDSIRCPGTKLYEIGDMALKATEMANTTINIIPDATSKMGECSKKAIWESPMCMADVLAKTTGTILSMTLDVTKLVTSATTFAFRLPSDLKTCMDVKMTNFRLKASHIPVEAGMCYGKTIAG